jgi:hypothetical protein
MARLKLCQLAVQVVVLRRALDLSRNHNDPAIPGDLDPGNIHTGRAGGPNGSGYILLPECGRRAGHKRQEGCLWRVVRPPLG